MWYPTACQHRGNAWVTVTSHVMSCICTTMNMHWHMCICIYICIYGHAACNVFLVFGFCSKRFSFPSLNKGATLCVCVVCVCVEHLNRCKTSNLLFSSYLYLYIGFISYTHFHLRPRFHLLGGRLVRFRFWGFSSLYIYILLYIQCRGAVNLIPSTAQRRRWFEIVISGLIIPTYLQFSILLCMATG